MLVRAEIHAVTEEWHDLGDSGPSAIRQMNLRRGLDVGCPKKMTLRLYFRLRSPGFADMRDVNYGSNYG